MATAPQLEARDGSGYTTTLSFTTNRATLVLKGAVANDTAALQVSVNGGGWVTDANLLKIEANAFTFPNPSVYPSGYNLTPGLNTVSFRTIDVSGGVSGSSTATISRVSSFSFVDASAIIPTSIKVERHRNYVDLLVSLGDSSPYPDLTFKGYNVYASKTPAGATGYFKVNETYIVPESEIYDEVPFGSTDYLALWSSSSRKFVRLRVTEEDEFGTELAVRLDQVDSLAESFDRLRLTGTLESYSLINYAKFSHYRVSLPGIINSTQWNGVASTSPLYYVFTAVFYDPVTNSEIESPYSQEVLGTPLILDTAILDLPNRTRTAIVTDYIGLVGRVNSEISLIPGSTTRDVSIDPFASEAERLWFMLDYVHRSHSFLSLLQIDNISGNGVSDTVATSPYKTALKAALGFSTDSGLQGFLDRQFDKLAGNINKTRLPGRSASGQVVFYTTTRPTVDINIPAGSTVTAGSVQYRVGGTYTISANNSEAFYNYTTKRYEVIADIAAVSPGSAGNVPAGAITKGTGFSKVSVINTEATVGGTDSESNADLAARCIASFAAVDTGTETGYYQTAAEQVGIIKSTVVKSGDRLMMRDWDEVREKHIGGKVDVWVQGLKERQVSEQFAFSYELAQDIQCLVVDLPTLTLRVLDSRVTPTNPIIEILNNLSQGFGVWNATIGANYDLTDVQVLDYQTFRLNTNLTQPATTLDDLIYADYRFRSENRFVLGFQPVRRIVSVVGELSGALTETVNYKLYKTDDPLLEGESTQATNYISVQQAAGKPVGNQIVVNNELHTLIGFVQEPLNSIGVNTNTLRVFNEDRTIEYVNEEDYQVVEGTDRTPVKILRTSDSGIPTGTVVSVDYIKDENFTVTYVVNDLLQQFQTVINNRRHVTADVLVKQAVINNIDIETTVQMKPGYSKDKVDPVIRTNVSSEINRRTIGQGVAQSDVIHAIDNSTGVDYEVLPLARMSYAEGSLILREEVLSNFVRVSALDAGAQRVYLLTDALNYPTTDNGGYETEHKGVFQDDVGLTLVSDFLQVGSLAGQAYIIGNDGAVLPGLTDATTAKTVANRVLVSLLSTDLPPDDPSNHSYAVSYQVRGDVGPHDIYGSEVEYLNLGDFTITYRAG